MPSDAVHVLDERLIARVEALGRRGARLELQQQQLQESLQRLQGEVSQLSSEIEDLLMVEELFKALIDGLVVKQVKLLEEVITEGLQTIFFDQDLHLESEVGFRYNRVTIEFFFRSGSSEAPIVIRGKPLDNFGGGPASFASLILRILAMQRLKKHPFLALDETLNAVSDTYIAPLGQFLQTYTKEAGLDVLLITHKTGYLNHATRSYQGRSVSVEGDSPKLQIQMFHEERRAN